MIPRPGARRAITTTVLAVAVLVLVVVAGAGSYFYFASTGAGTSTQTTSSSLSTTHQTTTTTTCCSTTQTTSSTSSSTTTTALGSSTVTSQTTTSSTVTSTSSTFSAPAGGSAIIIPPGIQSDNAKALNITFDPFNIRVVVGVNNTIYFYDADIQYTPGHVIESISWPTGGQVFAFPILPRQVQNFTLTTPGTYKYNCEWHPVWMTGTIVVVAGS